MTRTFKDNLKDLLKYEDITVKELAFRSGISKRSIENYLNARASMPPADYACKIAKVLNTTVEQLVGLEDSPNVHTQEQIEASRLYALIKRLSNEDKTAVLQIINSLNK